MSAISDLQTSVDKIVSDIDTKLAADAAALAAAAAQVADLTSQLAAFQGDADAAAAMKAKLDAADAKLA